MNKNEFDLLKEAIKDQFELVRHTREKISDATFQLIISQMDFLKTIASLVIGIAAISYFYDESNLDKMFLWLAFAFWITTLFIAISITREKIDFHAHDNDEIIKEVTTKAYTAIDMAVKAIHEQKPEIFYNFSENEVSQSEKPKPPSDYLGEVIVFLFYSSVSFLIVSAIPLCGFWLYLKILIAIWVLILSGILWFSDWSIKLFQKKINPFCDKMFKKDI